MSDPIEKPYRGKLEMWRRVICPVGYYYVGLFVGHPRYNGKRGHTSMVVHESGSSIETLNSRYSLGDPWSPPC